MFNRDWFCWREFATTLLSRRVRVSFPAGDGYTVVSEEGGDEVAVRCVHPDFDAALAAYRAEIAALTGGDFFEHPRPLVMERVHEGVRQAFLIRWPTTARVEWTLTRWDGTDPLRWNLEFPETLGAAIAEFDEHCLAARSIGFRDWVPRWPEGFEVVASDGLFTEHTTWTDDAPPAAEHRWFSAPGHPEVGPEWHAQSDGIFLVLCQVDGRAEGPTVYFGADRFAGVMIHQTGRSHGLTIFPRADGGIESMTVFDADVKRFSIVCRDAGRTATASLRWTPDDRPDLRLPERDFGALDLAYSARYGCDVRVTDVLDGTTRRRRRFANDRGQLTTEEHYDAAGTVQRLDKYEPAGTLLSRFFYDAGTLERAERYHPNGVLAERQPLDADGEMHGAVEVYDEAGVLSATVSFDHGALVSRVDAWPDVSAALTDAPDIAAFQRACVLFARAYARDPSRALAESLLPLVEGTSAWPAETRVAPAFWINDLVEGRLPNEALRPIAALRVLDLAVDTRDHYLCTREVFAARLDRLRAWLSALPADPSFALDVLDLSLTAWSAHAHSLPPTARDDGFDLRTSDFDASLVERVLRSPLAPKLRALVVSRLPWSDASPGDHDSYLDAERRQQGPAVEYDRRPGFLERLARMPCAATLQTLIARNAELIEPPAGVALPALKTLDVGFGSRQPNELLTSLAKGWAPKLKTLLLEPSPSVRWALALEDPKQRARLREGDGFFSHDYCCEPRELLLARAAIAPLLAREGVPKLATIVVGDEAGRFAAPAGGPKLARKPSGRRTFLDLGVVPWRVPSLPG